MPKRYFDKFPTVSYNGHRVRNITVSAALVNKYVNLPYSYSEYPLNGQQRADHVANDYYDDPYMTWMIYYANKIVDPYYDWHMSDDQLHGLMLKKYDSVEEANRRILFFRTNWYEDNRSLTPDQFRSMFGDYTDPHSTYWNPVYAGDSAKVLSYIRKENDYQINTNKLAKVQLANSTFESGDLLDIVSSGVTVGSAEVVSSNSTYAYVKNILGDMEVGSTFKRYSDSANTTVVAVGTNDDVTLPVWTIVNISDEEYAYWTPYTAYDMEIDSNANKSNVKVVDPVMALKIADRLEDELRGSES